MKRFLTIAFVALLALPALADSIDDAEAKRRGVPVQQVQLEHAQVQIAALQKQIDALKPQVVSLQKDIVAAHAQADSAKAELDKIKSALSPNQQAATQAAADLQQAIADAIKQHKVVLGMTLEDAKKALLGVSGNYGPRLVSEDQNSQVYQWDFYRIMDVGKPGDPPVYGGPVAASTLVTIQNGKVTRVHN